MTYLQLLRLLCTEHHTAVSDTGIVGQQLQDHDCCSLSLAMPLTSINVHPGLDRH